MPNKYECHSVQRQKKLFFKTDLHKNLLSLLCNRILLRREFFFSGQDGTQKR